MRLKEYSLFKQECFVNGRWIKAENGASFTVYNPVDNSVIGSVPGLGKKETEAAVDAAVKVWPVWRTLTSAQRAGFLLRWRELLWDSMEDLAVIMTTEQGKPLNESREEIMIGLGDIQWAAEEGQRLYGDVIPSPWSGKQPMTLLQPVGVVAAVTPWNFPMATIARKVAPALAAGCVVLAKPADATPFTALAMAELAARAGFPAGVFNVLTGSSEDIGSVFCANPEVRKLSFTGSTAMGQKFLASCADTIKKISLELGGNTPMIICPDADVDLAVAGTMIAKFRNAGQGSTSVTRVLAHESILENYLPRLLENVKTLTTGSGLEDGVVLGPLISDEACGAMQAFVDDAVSKGAKLLWGGKPDKKGGRFYQPTVLLQVTSEMRVFQEEIFGPILPIMTYKTEEEAIKLANSIPYGLAAYVFTSHLGSFWRIVSKLEHGLVAVNEADCISSEVPLGGIKHNGLGREGGWQGIRDFVETKYVLLSGFEK